MVQIESGNLLQSTKANFARRVLPADPLEGLPGAGKSAGKREGGGVLLGGAQLVTLLLQRRPQDVVRLEHGRLFGGGVGQNVPTRKLRRSACVAVCTQQNLRAFDQNFILRGSRVGGFLQRLLHVLQAVDVLVEERQIQPVVGIALAVPDGSAVLVFRSNLVFILLGNSNRKSTRLNSSHSSISYAVFCLKKKK